MNSIRVSNFRIEHAPAINELHESNPTNQVIGTHTSSKLRKLRPEIDHLMLYVNKPLNWREIIRANISEEPLPINLKSDIQVFPLDLSIQRERSLQRIIYRVILFTQCLLNRIKNCRKDCRKRIEPAGGIKGTNSGPDPASPWSQLLVEFVRVKKSLDYTKGSAATSLKYFISLSSFKTKKKRRKKEGWQRKESQLCVDAY